MTSGGLAAVSASAFAALYSAFGKYDVVHIHAEGPAFFSWLPKMFGKRVVVTIHGVDWQREKWQSGFGSKFIRQGEKNAVKYADEIIVLSKGVQDYFKETYGRETHFIPNGVNRPQIREANLITDKFGLKKDSYILFLGRLVPEKGIRYLVEAFKNVKTDKKLVIAGGSSDTDSFMEELKELAKDDNRILFTGFVQGAMLDELYSNAYIETIKKLPKMYFTNITGGEPFIRTDLKDIVRELYKKSDRIVISTNGFFTDRIVDLCKEFPQIGIRISIEGLEQTNNEIRGLQNGYQRGYGTLKKLREMGMKDVGFGMTVQDKNAPDLVPLYKISDEMGMEFATASLHNSFYFVEAKNIIHDRPMVAKNFENLVNELLRSNSPKKWFRAYFNHGLINYIYGQKRLLPCDMSFDTFFIDPYGDVMPCNGTKDKEVMGNLNNQTWDELWNSPEAEKVRAKVRCCDRDCWMIGSVSPAMHKYIWKPATWVLVHKFKALFTKHPYSMYELKICRDYRDGKVTKEDLDKCSTCDMNCVINNGLSEASKEQLKHKTGEEIVDADIAQQMETK